MPHRNILEISGAYIEEDLQEVVKPLSDEQRQKIQEIEWELATQKDADPRLDWFSFSTNGYRDQRDNIILLYNNFFQQEDREGWRVWAATPDGIPEMVSIRDVLKTHISIPDAQNPSIDKDATTFQLWLEHNDIYDGYNDVINIMCTETDPAKVWLWNQTEESRPIE